MANDKLCRLLFFICALKDAGAASVLLEASQRRTWSQELRSSAMCGM
jgi:hypothetical protein